MKKSSIIMTLLSISLLFACKKTDIKVTKTTGGGANWAHVERNIKSFIYKMDNYNRNNLSKNTLSETEYFDIDSARFYLENSFTYQYARNMPTENSTQFYNFSIGYYTKYENRVTMDDVNIVYDLVKDSLHNYFENINFEEKQLTDVIVAVEYSGNTVKFKITGAFGTVDPSIPFFDIPENITFQNYFSDSYKWKWDDAILKDYFNNIYSAPDLTINQFKKFFWLRQQLSVSQPQSNQYMWVKDPTPYGINENNQVDVVYGPPANHYYTPAPLVFPNDPQILHVCYFMAGSTDFTIDPTDEKTWITTHMLDFYLPNIINLASLNNPGTNYMPWQLTSTSGQNPSFVIEYPNPAFSNNQNYMNLRWRRWVFGVYYAQQTTITLPPVLPI